MQFGCFLFPVCGQERVEIIHTFLQSFPPLIAETAGHFQCIWVEGKLASARELVPLLIFFIDLPPTTSMAEPYMSNMSLL